MPEAKLNIKGLAKTRLSKSINYGLGGDNSCLFLLSKPLAQILLRRQMLEVKTIAVNPKNTSQDCSNCGEKVLKELSQRTHFCPDCDIVIERDLNATINIKNRATGHPVLKDRGVRCFLQDCKTRSPPHTLRLAWEYVTKN